MTAIEPVITGQIKQSPTSPWTCVAVYCAHSRWLCRFRSADARPRPNPQIHFQAWRPVSGKFDTREGRSLPVSVDFLWLAVFPLWARSFPSSWSSFLLSTGAPILRLFENGSTTKIQIGRITLTNACALCRPSNAKNRSEEHTSELQSLRHLVCRLLLEKKKKKT